jgi:hypothetical protein
VSGRFGDLQVAGQASIVFALGQGFSAGSNRSAHNGDSGSPETVLTLITLPSWFLSANGTELNR